MKLISLIMFFVLSTLGLSACATEAQPAPVKGVEQVAKVATPKAQPTKAQPAKVCQEDDPCWDCHTMGNKVCGPVKAPAKPAPAFKAQPTPTITEAVAPAPTTTPKAVPAPVVKAAPKPTACDLKCEAVKFRNYNYIPMDEVTTVTYLGTSTVDRTNGDDIYSVRSAFNPALWHSYRIVDPHYVAPATAPVQPDCNNLQLGDAKAGIMLDCYREEALAEYTGPDSNYLGSAFTVPTDQGVTYWFASDKYPGIFHYFKG